MGKMRENSKKNGVLSKHWENGFRSGTNPPCDESQDEFAGEVPGRPADVLRYLGQTFLLELVVLDNVLKMLVNVGQGLLQQVDKVVFLGQLHHVEAVVGLQVAFQELCAVRFQLGDATRVGYVQNNIDVVLVYHNLT